MARFVLLLRLEGPLQSWGSRSRWDVRDTQPEPTKSGVIGLLGCALGYPVGDLRLQSELDAGLRFGVRIEAPGRVRRDYQTITDYLPTAAGAYRHSGVATGKDLEKIRANPDFKPSTIISPRDYLEDAAFLVGFEEKAGAPSDLLGRCEAALINPRWPLYLGRKCCAPTRPVIDYFGNDYAGLAEALLRHPWSWLGSETHQRNPVSDQLFGYIEDGTGPLARQDAIRINPARLYAFRGVREFSVSMSAVTVSPLGEAAL